ncbi:MAG: hypothetical protein ACREO9_05035 [Lysobacterales bacterium]
MKTCVLVLLAMACSFNLQAQSNFVDNPLTPYPPGCATTPSMQALLYGHNIAKFYDQDLVLPGSFGEYPVNVKAYRVGCTEPNRSVIWLAFQISSQVPDSMLEYTAYTLPKAVFQDSRGIRKIMSLVSEPNSWDVGYEEDQYARKFGDLRLESGGGTDARNWTWIYVLDNQSPFYTYGYQLVSPEEYNGSFQLLLNGKGMWDSASANVIEVPSTASLLSPNPGIPLNGRLSGLWVIDGTSDQGFNISISNLAESSDPELAPPAESPLLIFLSWFTFGANGEALWLTGSAQFTEGAKTINIPIEMVNNGQFFGAKSAERRVVGNVTLSGKSCNDLSFEYDLGSLGLGSGTKRLERLFSLETAGFACRDLEARVLANWVTN